MVSDRELEVWQNNDSLIIQSRYCDDPRFTLDQEKALHEIARSFLIVNRKRESDKRRKDRVKRKKELNT
jgi:phage anti-repressor protein